MYMYMYMWLLDREHLCLCNLLLYNVHYNIDILYMMLTCALNTILTVGIIFMYHALYLYTCSTCACTCMHTYTLVQEMYWFVDDGYDNILIEGIHHVMGGSFALHGKCTISLHWTHTIAHTLCMYTLYMYMYVVVGYTHVLTRWVGIMQSCTERTTA